MFYGCIWLFWQVLASFDGCSENRDGSNSVAGPVGTQKVTEMSIFVIISVPNAVWDAKSDDSGDFRHHFRPRDLLRVPGVK